MLRNAGARNVIATRHRNARLAVVYPRRAFSIAATSILRHGHHRLERALGLIAAGLPCLGQDAGRDLPGQAPFVLAPATGAFLSAIADDGVPVAVGLGLVVGRDLERERFALLEGGPAIQSETGNAEHGEFHRQHVARLAAGKVGRRLVHGRHRAVGKGRGIEPRRLLGVLVEPQADGIFVHCFPPRREPCVRLRQRGPAISRRPSARPH